jgi:hypothetical protein
MRLMTTDECIEFLFNKGVDLDSIEVKYIQLRNTKKCTFDLAGTGACNKPARISMTYKEGEYHLCEDHSKVRCGICGKPAIRQCSFPGQFVCGKPLCPDCECEH